MLDRRHPILRRAALPAVLAAALALAACGGGGGSTPTTSGTSGGTATGGSTTTAPPATTTTTTTPPGTTTAPGTTTGIDPLTGAGTEPVVVKATNAKTALLTDVRVARHEGYDRVVLQFRDALPGYDVRYVSRPVHQDGSGREVTVAGASVVQIRMENALDADLEQSGSPMTYTGPTRLSPGTPEVAELARIGGFENVLTWVAGLRDRVDFRVSTLADPPRLIVDFRNH